MNAAVDIANGAKNNVAIAANALDRAIDVACRLLDGFVVPVRVPLAVAATDGIEFDVGQHADGRLLGHDDVLLGWVEVLDRALPGRALLALLTDMNAAVYIAHGAKNNVVVAADILHRTLDVTCRLLDGFAAP